MIHYLTKPIAVKNELFSIPPISGNQGNKSVKNEYLNIEAGSDKWMELACDLATESVKKGGGPFGAVILQIERNTQQIIRYWEASNKVTSMNDPTAHAEILAIRSASHSLGVFNLGEIRKKDTKLDQNTDKTYCVIYSSCEPCPMCFSAIAWARIPFLFFAASRYDAAQPGVEFSDKEIYEELEKPYNSRNIKVHKCNPSNYMDAFELWKKTDHKDY